MNDDNLIMIVVKVEPSNYQHISITGNTTICVINGTLSVHSKILENRNIIQKWRNLGFDVLESRPQKPIDVWTQEVHQTPLNSRDACRIFMELCPLRWVKLNPLVTNTSISHQHAFPILLQICFTNSSNYSGLRNCIM